MDDLLKALRDATNSEQSAGNPLAGLLSGIFGAAPQEEDDAADSVSGIAEQSGITPDVAQAVMALVAGQLASRQAGGGDKTKGAGLDELLEQARGGQEVDETALKASDLPQNLAKSTGLDLSEAIRVLQKLLPSLAALLGLPGAKPATKPKPKPRPTAKPRPAAKPKPATKPKPSAASRPKPSASATKPAAKPKPKPSTTSRPKPSSSAAKPKPKPRRRSDKSGAEGSELENLLDNA